MTRWRRSQQTECARQEEASEEPKTAAKMGAHANYELYFRNKLCAPLGEIFQTCLSPAQVQVRN